MDGHVLVVDNDPATCELLRETLSHDGYRVQIATSRDEVLALACAFDVVIAGVELDLVAPLRAKSPWTEVVVLADANHIAAAITALRQGAFDFIVHPFFIEDVSLTVACARARRGRGVESMDSPLAHVRKYNEPVR